jgi:ligand-binding sensor domain-containing protein
VGTPGERGALVFTSNDLQQWRWVEGGPARPLANTRVNALAIRDGTAWLATTRGVLRMSLANEEAARQWNLTDGLPSDVATSVAVHADRVWVATPSGLALVERSARPIGPRVGIHDLLVWTDTLWIASSTGLLALAGADSAPRRVAIDDARLTHSVVALARSDTVLALASETDLIEIDLASRRVLPPRAASVAALRRIARMAMDANTLWVVGEGGAVVIHRASGRSTLLAAGAALPAGATSVALSRDVAWVGTRQGLVRIRRRSDGMPP